MTDQATTTDPSTIIPSPPVKPGYMTTEFYFASAAKVVGIAFASGLMGQGTVAERIAGLVAMVLGMLGYTVSRTMVKVAAMVALFLVIPLSSTACTHQKLVAGEHALWDCTSPERAQAVDALTPMATTAILAAASADGKLIDTAKARQTFSKANLLTDAGQLALCVAASAFSSLIASSSVAPAAGAPAAEGLRVDPAALRRAFEDLRSSQFPGVTVVTASGPL